jgi:hypothetical protein
MLCRNCTDEGLGGGERGPRGHLAPVAPIRVRRRRQVFACHHEVFVHPHVGTRLSADMSKHRLAGHAVSNTDKKSQRPSDQGGSGIMPSH